MNWPAKCGFILRAAELGWNCFWYWRLFILLDWLLGEVELALGPDGQQGQGGVYL